MRAFIVLCLVAVACADKLGYDYQPVGHSNSGLSFAPGGGSYGDDALSAPIYGSDGTSSFGSQVANNAPSYGSENLSGPISAGPASNDQASNESPAFAPQGELDKEFYTFAANDEDFNDPAAANQIANSVKQGLRVVFIKGPDNRGLEDAALSLAKQAADQKTAIYVLNKQADLADLANRLNSANSNNNNKPDVHFVKYRTPEDAANAQKAIQDQYDSLGGNSQSINGGIAPVLNFASQAPVAAPSVSAPGNNYLPASVLRRFRL